VDNQRLRVKHTCHVIRIITWHGWITVGVIRPSGGINFCQKLIERTRWLRRYSGRLVEPDRAEEPETAPAPEYTSHRLSTYRSYTVILSHVAMRLHCINEVDNITDILRRLADSAMFQVGRSDGATERGWGREHAGIAISTMLSSRDERIKCGRRFKSLHAAARPSSYIMAITLYLRESCCYCRSCCCAPIAASVLSNYAAAWRSARAGRRKVIIIRRSHSAPSPPPTTLDRRTDDRTDERGAPRFYEMPQYQRRCNRRAARETSCPRIWLFLARSFACPPHQ